MNFEEKQNQIVDKYRSISLKFIDSNKHNLIQIYLEHSKKDGDGVISIKLNDDTKIIIDVAFIPMILLPINLIEKINFRKSENNNNIIYFFLNTPVEEQIIEIDIRNLCN